jgi:hypothetical protein
MTCGTSPGGGEDDFILQLHFAASAMDSICTLQTPQCGTGRTPHGGGFGPLNWPCACCRPEEVAHADVDKGRIPAHHRAARTARGGWTAAGTEDAVDNGKLLHPNERGGQVSLSPPPSTLPTLSKETAHGFDPVALGRKLKSNSAASV